MTYLVLTKSRGKPSKVPTTPAAKPAIIILLGPVIKTDVLAKIRTINEQMKVVIIEIRIVPPIASSPRWNVIGCAICCLDCVRLCALNALWLDCQSRLDAMRCLCS